MQYRLITGEKFFNINKLLFSIAPNQKGVIVCDKQSYIKTAFSLSKQLSENKIKIVTVILEKDTLFIDNLKNLSLLPEDARFIISVGERSKQIASYLATIKNLPHLTLVDFLPLNLYPKNKIIIRDDKFFYNFICDCTTYVFIDLNQIIAYEGFAKHLFCYLVSKILWLKEYIALTNDNKEKLIEIATQTLMELQKDKIDVSKLMTNYLYLENKILSLDNGDVYSAEFLCALNGEYLPSVEQNFISAYNILKYISTAKSSPPNYNERAKTVAFLLGLDQNLVLEKTFNQLKSIKRPVKSISVEKTFLKEIKKQYAILGGKPFDLDKKTFLAGDSPFNINALTLLREV